MANQIKLKRGLAASVAALTTDRGEIINAYDDGRVFIGKTDSSTDKWEYWPSSASYTDALNTLLGTVEENADVTDFANVSAALAAADADVNINGQKLTGVATPGASTDGANKSYVDNLFAGVRDIKESVRVATTTSGTLSTSFANSSVVDGVTLSTGDRILIKDQSTASENGVYTVNSSGAPTRATDYDEDAEVTSGAFCFVEEGTSNGTSGWVLATTGTITVGTTGLSYSKFSQTAGVTALANLTDTNITGPTTDDLLLWDGTDWADKSFSEAGLQTSLTFGILDTNALKIDGTATNGEYGIFTANGLTSLSGSTLKVNLSLDNVENTALSTAVIDGGTF